LVQSQKRFREQRIAEQTDGAPDVARAVQKVWIGRAEMADARKPSLQQWSRRRQHKAWQADTQGQRGDQPRDRIGVTARWIAHPDCDGQQEEWNQRDREVQSRLRPPRQPLRCDVSVGISTEQNRLIEDCCGVPYGRSATEAG
jgi:hypothetical protein